MVTVLLVEDDAQVRELVAQYLQREGLTTVAVPTGGAGLEAMASRQPDLVILDVNLPDLDGWSILRRIRDEWGDAPAVIMLTRAAMSRTACSASIWGQMITSSSPSVRGRWRPG